MLAAKVIMLLTVVVAVVLTEKVGLALPRLSVPAVEGIVAGAGVDGDPADVDITVDGYSGVRLTETETGAVIIAVVPRSIAKNFPATRIDLSCPKCRFPHRPCREYSPDPN